MTSVRSNCARALAAVALAGIVVGCGSTAPTATPTATATATATATPTPTDSPTATPSPTPEPSLGPTPLPSGMDYADLDGVIAPIDHAHRLPLAIMIDDSRGARPQSGFSSASIVYQAMIDDQSDRYMMVFQEGDATDIGPVRSSRPYYVYWAAEYKALYGHFGGDASALRQVIPAMANFIYDEDDLRGGACPYHRIKTRVSPYNAYTNTAILLTCAAKRGYPITFQNVPTRTFVEDSPAASLPASQSIVIPYPADKIGYAFDPSTDSYLRSVNGALQTDPANGQQVTARNIVVLFQAYAVVPSLDKMRPQVTNVGTGKAIVFKEGQAIVGTWKKTGNAGLTRFYDPSGNEIPLLRGQTFIQSVPINLAVSYK